MTPKEYALQETFDYGSAHWLLQKRAANDRRALANFAEQERREALEALYGCVDCTRSNPRHCAESGHLDCAARAETTEACAVLELAVEKGGRND